MKRQAKQNLLQDYDVIDAFIEYLRKHGYPELTVTSYPDKENRSSPDIDAIAGPFAIEHTSIDTLPNQRRNNDWFKKVLGNLEQEFDFPKVNFRFAWVLRFLMMLSVKEKGKTG